MHCKDYIFSILVFYVVVDMSMAYMIRKNHPQMFYTFTHMLKSRVSIIPIILGLVAAILCLYWK